MSGHLPPIHGVYKGGKGRTYAAAGFAAAKGTGRRHRLVVKAQGQA